MINIKIIKLMSCLIKKTNKLAHERLKHTCKNKLRQKKCTKKFKIGLIN